MELSIIIIFSITMLTIVILQILRYKTIDQQSKESEAKSKEERSRLELEKQKLNLELTDAYAKIIKAEDKRSEDDPKDEDGTLLGIASDLLEEVGKK